MVNENIKKKDMELILEVNKKAIEIETEVADQNEEIIASLTDLKKQQDEQGEKINSLIANSTEYHKDLSKKSDDHHKDLFKLQVLFVTGLISLVIQILQMIKK